MKFMVSHQDEEENFKEILKKHFGTSGVEILNSRRDSFGICITEVELAEDYGSRWRSLHRRADALEELKEEEWILGVRITEA